jgi:hypothetical protein
MGRNCLAEKIIHLQSAKELNNSANVQECNSTKGIYLKLTYQYKFCVKYLLYASGNFITENNIAMKKLFFLLSVLITTVSFAQKNNKEAISVKQLLDEQKFCFVAQTMLPQSGSTRMIDSYYDLKITKEKIVCSLPYFGRAYSATIGSNTGPLDFTAADFSYDSKPTKKGTATEIKIIPAKSANTDVNLMVLTVFDNGNASLQVTFNNRQAISYNGNIRALKEEKVAAN